MTKKIGKTGAMVTGVGVAGLLVSMLVGLATGVSVSFASMLSGIVIALGYVTFASALAGKSDAKKHRTVALAGVAFAVIYAVLILIVYYAGVTTVHLDTTLSEEALSLIDYSHNGSLLFNYDLLGYGMMALSTFWLGLTIAPKRRSDGVFRWLMIIHGVFFLPCLIIPMFPIFTNGSDPLIGTIILVVWCLYFLPVCGLGWRYFREVR